MRQQVCALCLCLTLQLALAGCGLSKGMVKRATRVAKVSSGKLSLHIVISDNANENSPVAVDVLFIKDKAFLKTVQGMSASDWFMKKAQLQRQNPKAMKVESWEGVPKQNPNPDPIELLVPVDAQAALLFANYNSAGPHSAALPTKGKVTLDLGDEDFTVESK